MRASRPNLAFAAMIAGLILGATGAQAHPHVWVIMNETVLYDKGSITGLQQAWTFDEFYTQQAIEGLDKNGDGKYDREELKDLAQVNIDGLKEFAYFTFAKLGDTELKFKPPVDYWLDYSDKKILTLHFTLLLEQPVSAQASGFNFAVFDFELLHRLRLRRGRSRQTRRQRARRLQADDPWARRGRRRAKAERGVLRCHEPAGDDEHGRRRQDRRRRVRQVIIPIAA